MPTAQTTETTLNSLLRGELAATETYQQALTKGGDQRGVAEIRQIHLDHREAANTLRRHVREHAGTPEQGSGAWGAFAKAVEGTAKVFGNTAALKGLKQGEEHGVNSYENALKDGGLPPECETLILSTLLPRTRAHVATLELLIAGK